VGTLAYGESVAIAEATRPPRPARVFVNLLDADAHPDVGVARGATLFSALGDGAGGFGRLAPIRTGHPSRILDADTGDFDGDGINDAVLADLLRKRSVLTVSGTPSGRLAGRRRAVFLGDGRGPRGAVVADWNGDLVDDIATANRHAPTLTVLTATESGSWERQSIALPFQPADLVAADVDGDTRTDLVAASARGTLVILRNREGRFAGPPLRVPMHRTRWWGRGTSIDVADLNRDGAADLVSLRSDGALAVRLATPPNLAGPDDPDTLSFEPPLESTLSCGGRGKGESHRDPWGRLAAWFGGWRGGSCRFVGLAVGDVDLDGTNDLVAAAPHAAADLRVLFGRGDGAFEPGFALRTPGAQASDLRLADVNGDGRLDPVVGAENGAAFALPSRCACRAPFEGPTCDACNGPGCPVGGDPLARQQAVGPPLIVPLGADLVGASLEEPRDRTRAALVAQRLAALTLESDAVVVATPLRDRQEEFLSGRSRVATTVTTFEVQEVLKGAVRGVVEVSQEGGSLVSGERQDSGNQFPFPNADDLAICPGAAGASAAASGPAPTSLYWLLFLREGPVSHSLLGNLSLPALPVRPEEGQFVLPDRESGLLLPVGELAGLPDGRRVR
jgi:hypothetical protein